MDVGIRAGRLITPEEEKTDMFVGIHEGVIQSVVPYQDALRSTVGRFIDAAGETVVPGFVDLQVNGGLGHNVMLADRDQRREIYRFFLRRGTTTLLPTVVTAGPDTLREALGSLAEDVELSGRTDPVAFDRPEIPGIHLEGPFLHPERRGAHPIEHLRQPDLDLARALFEIAKGRIAILTLAPELEGASALIREFARRGVVVAAGHTLATCDVLLRACDDGLQMITHVGNVSDWPYRRKNEAGIFASEPGVVGTFMISDRLRASVILDGYHFDARLAAALARLRGPGSLAIISDASYAAGCPPGAYDDGLIKTTVHPDGYAYATGGEGWLAGSVITMERAVRVAVRKAGIPLRDAVEMAALTPARILGLDGRKGRIAPGFDADLVCLDRDLAVQKVFRAGQEVAL